MILKQSKQYQVGFYICSLVHYISTYKTHSKGSHRVSRSVKPWIKQHKLSPHLSPTNHLLDLPELRTPAIIDTFKLWLQVLHVKYMAIWMRFLSILVFGSNKNREVTRIFIFVSFDHDKRTCFLFLENPLIVHWRNVPVENKERVKV